MTGNELKAFRKSVGMTQQELADQWGVSRVVVYQAEGRGTKVIPRGPELQVKLLQLQGRINDAFGPIERAKKFIESEAYAYSCASLSENASDDDKSMARKLQDLNDELEAAVEVLSGVGQSVGDHG